MLTLLSPLDAKDQHLALEIDRVLRRKSPDLRPAQVATWSESPRLVRDRSKPWVITPIELDPHVTPGGGYPFPEEVARSLAAIAKSGTCFERIAVAHEIDASSQAKNLPKAIPDAGMRVTPAQVKTLIGTLPAPKEAQATAAAIEKGFDLIVGGLIGTAGLLAAPFALVDPIVFGVVGIGHRPKDGRPALYYPLAAWEW